MVGIIVSIVVITACIVISSIKQKNASCGSTEFEHTAWYRGK